VRRASRKFLLRVYERALLVALGALVLLGAGLGYSGLLRLARGDPTFLGDTAGRLFELATLRLPIHLAESPPWELLVARTALPLALALLLLYGLARLLRGPIEGAAAARERDHVVVCGDAPVLRTIARNLLEAKHRVVCIRSPDADGRAPRLELPGVIELRGNTLDEEALRRAAVSEARAVIVLGGSDLENLRVGGIAERLCEERTPGRPPLRVIVEITDDSNRDAIAARRSESGRRAELSFLLRDRTAARLLLREHRLDSFADLEGGQRLHALVVFASGAGEQLLHEILRSGYVDERGPQVTVADPEAERVAARIRSRLPEIETICDLDFRELPEDDARGFFAALLDEHAETPFTTVYFCADEPLRSLRTIGAFHAAVLETFSNVPALLVCAARDSLDMLDPQTAGIDARGLVAFGGSDELYSAGVLLGEELDRIARTMHEGYLAQRRAAGENVEALPAGAPWERLAETFRDANRHPADHTETKLRAIGCTSIEAAAPRDFAFTSEELESCTWLEHLRWMGERYAEGWIHGDHRDDRRRRHPSLVAFRLLSESEKAKDRETVEALPAQLMAAGREIRRDCVVGVVSDAEADAAEAGLAVALGRALADLAAAHPDRRLVLLSALRTRAERRAVTGFLASVAGRKALLRVPLDRPVELLVDAMDDRDEARGFLAALASADRVFALPLAPEERAALRKGVPLGAAPEARLAALVAERSERLAILRGSRAGGRDSFVERCLAAKPDSTPRAGWAIAVVADER